MFELFDINSVSKENFIPLKLSPTSYYYGEIEVLNLEGEAVKLLSSQENLSSILKDPSVKKQRNGFGIQIDLSKENNFKELEFNYEGEFKNDLMDGIGCLKYKTGAIYNGRLANGQRDGYGRLVWPGGDSYQGFWRDGRMEGAGVFCAERNQYKGNFVNNMFVTKENFLLCPFLDIDKDEDFCRIDRKAKSARDKNLHRRNFVLKSVCQPAEIRLMAVEAFLNDRFVLAVSRLNSGWNFKQFSAVFSEGRKIELDCYRASFLYENSKEEFQGLMSDFCRQLSEILQKGGLVLLNFDEPNFIADKNGFDPDMYFILNFSKELGKLLSPKEFKSAANLEPFIGPGKLSPDVGVILYSNFRLEKDLETEFAIQKARSRFQFVCNPQFADIAILEKPA